MRCGLVIPSCCLAVAQCDRDRDRRCGRARRWPGRDHAHHRSAACVAEGVMMLGGTELLVLVATRPVDFRKQADTLAAFVQQALGADPYSGAAYVFRAKRADRVKLLWWDGTGVCPCCGGDLHKIGEDVSKRLDKVPAKLVVVVT